MIATQINLSFNREFPIHMFYDPASGLFTLRFSFLTLSVGTAMLWRMTSIHPEPLSLSWLPSGHRSTLGGAPHTTPKAWGFPEPGRLSDPAKGPLRTFIISDAF